MSRKKKVSRKRSAASNNRKLWVFLVTLVVILMGLLIFVAYMESRGDGKPQPQETLGEETFQTQPDAPVSTQVATEHQPDETQESQPVEGLDLGGGIVITDYLPYTGAFMEDRTDDVVSGVLGIRVTNTGEKYIQTMDITLTDGNETAEFSLSTLFPGQSVVVLEKNRMAYSDALLFTDFETGSVAFFDGDPGMAEDKLEIQCLDGVINVTNISDEDVTGDILIYYKNYTSGMYYGGITYRIRIAGGLKSGEIWQGTAAHFNPANSAVVFVTCG